jgi:hypothetical protein
VQRSTRGRPGRQDSAPLARRVDAAQLLQPGPALAGELRSLVTGRIAAYRRNAAMHGTRGLSDPDGLAQRLLDRLLGMGYLAPGPGAPESSWRRRAWRV